MPPGGEPGKNAGTQGAGRKMSCQVCPEGPGHGVKGRALQEKAKDIPGKVAGCIDLPAEKARQLYVLLYELLENQGYGKKKNKEGEQK